MTATTLIRDKISSLHRKGFLYVLSALVVAHCISFLQNIFVSSMLDKQEFGAFTMIVETINYTSGLLVLGLPFAMMQFGLSSGKMEYFFSGVFRIFAILSVLLVAGYLALTFFVDLFNDERVNTLLRFMIVLSPFLAVFSYIVTYLSAVKRPRSRALLVLLQKVFSFILIVSGCFLFRFRGVAGGYAVSIALFSVAIFYFFAPALDRKVERFPYRKVVTFSVWDSLGIFCTLSAVYLLYSLTERVLDDLRLVSIFKIAFQFNLIARLCFSSINDLIYPYLMEKKTRREYSALVGKVLLLDVLLSALILATAYLVIPPLIEFVWKAKYLDSIPVFKLVIYGEIMIGFSLFFEIVLRMLGGVRYKAVSTLAVLAVFVAVTPVLLRNYGINGAAYAFLFYAAGRLGASLTGSAYSIYSGKFDAHMSGSEGDAR